MTVNKNWAHIDYPQLFLRQNTIDAKEKDTELINQYKRGYFIIESATRLEIIRSIGRELTHRRNRNKMNTKYEDGVRVFSDCFLSKHGRKQQEIKNIHLAIFEHDICHLLQVMHLIGVTIDDNK